MKEPKCAKILVTGVNDMIGMHVMSTLKWLGNKVIGIGDIHSDLESLQYLENQIVNFKPDIILYIPGDRHGIAIHKQFPGTVYYESVIVFAHLMEAARKNGVSKVVNILSNCVYPDNIPVPYRESDIWNGLPEATLIPHGLGRRISLIQAAAFHAQYGMRTISLILASVYGSHDNFDPCSSQVMASMIRRFLEATERKMDKVVCWGTGKPKREFIYVFDVVRGIIEATTIYDSDEPLNIGTQNDVSIRELAQMISNIVGYRGTIEWDESRPDGRSRVCLDSSRMQKLLPKWKLISLEEGIAQTANWYKNTPDGLYSLNPIAV